MVGFCLIGAGVIGTGHAANIAAHPEATLRYVVDVVEEAGRGLADRHGAQLCDDVETALGDAAIDAVVVASDARTHADFVTRAARETAGP